MITNKSAEVSSREATGYKENTLFGASIRGKVFIHSALHGNLT